jgi:hypothetical protein
VNEDILSRSAPLVFTEAGPGGKWYAETPAGEFAYSDSQGLYEWRRVPVTWPAGSVLPGLGTTLVRIQYSGGDRQGSSDGQMWHAGPESPGRDVALYPYPHALGLQAALHPARMN